MTTMVDPTPEEQAVLRACLPLLAEAMAEIGWTRRLNELSEAQALTLVEVAVSGFQNGLRDFPSPPVPEAPF